MVMDILYWQKKTVGINSEKENFEFEEQIKG